uniref:Uncharacterized protein YBL113C-like n=1 Tax=Saccoglossus kowalevskii TaxID=10224 RepID=A0ABM0MS27_SACKO|nr:PREDICTED: uncharacterized protein YBL113C-like [Saccoglossus kowalevskii]
MVFSKLYIVLWIALFCVFVDVSVGVPIKASMNSTPTTSVQSTTSPSSSGAHDTAAAGAKTSQLNATQPSTMRTDVTVMTDAADPKLSETLLVHHTTESLSPDVSTTISSNHSSVTTKNDFQVNTITTTESTVFGETTMTSNDANNPGEAVTTPESIVIGMPVTLPSVDESGEYINVSTVEPNHVSTSNMTSHGLTNTVTANDGREEHTTHLTNPDSTGGAELLPSYAPTTAPSSPMLTRPVNPTTSTNDTVISTTVPTTNTQATLTSNTTVENRSASLTSSSFATSPEYPQMNITDLSLNSVTTDEANTLNNYIEENVTLPTDPATTAVEVLLSNAQTKTPHSLYSTKSEYAITATSETMISTTVPKTTLQSSTFNKTTRRHNTPKRHY